MLSNAGACMAIVISISGLVSIAIEISIADNSISEFKDAITQKIVPLKFTITLTLSSSTLTHSASHFYAVLSIFFPLNVYFTVLFIFHWCALCPSWTIGESYREAP